MRSWTNYILDTDGCLLQNVVVRDAWHNMNHYLVLGYLHGAAPTTNSLYPRKRTHFLINTKTTLEEVDCLFDEIHEDTTKPTLCEHLRQS